MGTKIIHTSEVIVDPMNSNYAIRRSSDPTDSDSESYPELLIAMRLLPHTSPHFEEGRPPTLDEIKAAPIVGYTSHQSPRPHQRKN